MLSFLTLSLLYVSLIIGSHPTIAAIYPVVKEYSGPNFFDDWDFFDDYDSTTSGDEIYLGAQATSDAKLAFVDSQTNHAFLKVDNTTTVVFDNKRNSVKITTKDSFNMGSVWVADIFHVPFGCSVWPAMWSWAPIVNTSWPAGGEIDTLEGFNQAAFSQMGLHTLNGCQQVNPQQSSKVVNTTDCLGDENEGCVVTNAGLPSYGPGFSEIEGGVFVTEYADTAISIWFFPRSNIPSSVTSSATTIDTSTLGLPVGNWPAVGCPGGFSNFFLPQSIVFDIVLCGSLGNGTYSQTCSGNCFMDNVLGNGSNYANAYFEIGSVRVFSQNVTNSSSGASSSSGANPSPSSSVLPVDGGWFVTVGFAVSIAGLLLMSS